MNGYTFFFFRHIDALLRIDIFSPPPRVSSIVDHNTRPRTVFRPNIQTLGFAELASVMPAIMNEYSRPDMTTMYGASEVRAFPCQRERGFAFASEQKQEHLLSRYVSAILWSGTMLKVAPP